MAWRKVRVIVGDLKSVFASVEVDPSKHAIKGVLKKGFVTERAEELPSLVVPQEIVRAGNESAILKAIYDSATSFAGRIFMRTGVIQNQIRKFAKNLGFGDLSESLVSLFDMAIANIRGLEKPLVTLGERRSTGPVSVEVTSGDDGIVVFAEGIKLFELRTSEAQRCAVEISDRITAFLVPEDDDGDDRDDLGTGPRKRKRDDDEDIGKQPTKRRALKKNKGSK